MKSLPFFLFTFFPLLLFAQSLSLHPEVEQKIEQWYAENPKEYRLPVKGSKIKAEITGYYENTANLIRLKWNGMLLEFAFKKDLAKISTHADSLQKYFSYASANDIYMDIDVADWDLHPRTSLSSYRDGVKFIDNGKGSFALIANWDIYAVLGYKDSDFCRERMSWADAPTPAECIVSKRKKIDFILDVDVFIEDIEAPEPKSYPQHLKVETKLFGQKEQKVLGLFEDKSVFSYQKNGQHFKLSYHAREAQEGWSYDLKPEKDHVYYPQGAVQDQEGNTYVLFRAFEMDRASYTYLLKWDRRGKLEWKMKEKENYFIYKTLLTGRNGDILLAGNAIIAYSPQGKKQWSYRNAEASMDINQILEVDKTYMAVGTGNLKENFTNITDMLVLQFSQDGKLLKKQTYGGSGIDEAEAICATQDGGWVIAGETDSKDGQVKGLKGENNIWVVKLNKRLKIQWQRCLGSSHVARFSPFKVVAAVHETDNGEVLVIGHNTDDDVEVEDIGDVDAYIALLDEKGELKWQQSLGTVNFDYISSVHFDKEGLLLSINDELVKYELMR
jgi:hypothetical protein